MFSSNKKVVDPQSVLHAKPRTYEEYRQKREYWESILPAYSRSALQINYRYSESGLTLRFSTGPYEGSGMTLGYPKLKSFYLAYNPDNFRSDPILKLALGTTPVIVEPLILVEKHVEIGRMFIVGKDGDWTTLHVLRGPLEKGAFYVSGDTGKIFFVPARAKGVKEIFRKVITEAQTLRKQDSGVVGHWWAELNPQMECSRENSVSSV